MHLHRIAGHEQFLGDAGIAEALAGQLGHLPLDWAQAGPPVRSTRTFPVAALSVVDSLRKGQPGTLLRCFLEVVVAQCSTADGQGPLGLLANVRESDEPEDA